MDSSETDLLLEFVPGYSGLPQATLGELGGEAALLASTASEDLLAGTVALCAAWSQLSDTAAAATFIERAVANLDPSELIPFNDVVLAAATALPVLAPGLARAWSHIAGNDPTLIGNIAIEGWTRLALGGWCATTLPLRAALATRGTDATSGETDADPFLIRSIAAAADAWAERDLIPVLENLAEIEDVETDAAFELGMLHLRDAVQANDLDNALAELIAAMTDFERASIEDDRPDATAFLAACHAVHAFATGNPVPTQSVAAVKSAAEEWLRGYLGDDPHWRQSRSDVVTEWAALVRTLNAVADLNEPAWYDTAALLADAGRLYVAYNATTLLAKPPRRDEPTHANATPVILGPRLDAGLAASADKLRLVDRWLESNSQRTDDAASVAAISEARKRLRAPQPPPGKGHASRDGLPDEVREALKQSPNISSFEAVEQSTGPLIAPGKPIPLLIRRVRDRALRELAAICPDAYADWSIHVAEVVGHYVRCVANTIDRQQGGARNLPWHNPIEAGKRPAEHYLADHLATWFEANLFLVTSEGANIGGGRADVVIWVGVERFVIEVKQIAAARTNDELSADYGPQAQQYTMTAAPFAFLAVLDNRPRTSRIDLESSLWTSSWTNVETSATHALTGARVLADVKPPSAQPSTRKAARKKASTPATKKTAAPSRRIEASSSLKGP